MVPPPLSTLLSDCYGDEGARYSLSGCNTFNGWHGLHRLAQLFDISFQSQDELCQVSAILLMGDSGIGKYALSFQWFACHVDIDRVGKSTVLDMIASQHGLKVTKEKRCGTHIFMLWLGVTCRHGRDVCTTRGTICYCAGTFSMGYSGCTKRIM